MRKSFGSLDRNQYLHRSDRTQPLRAYANGQFLELQLSAERCYSFDEKDAEWLIEICSDWLQERQRQSIRPEIGAYYRHFNGDVYKVSDIVRHTETDEEMMVYHTVEMLSNGYISLANVRWTRPLSMWNEMVSDSNGNKVPRFSRITPNEDFWKRVRETYRETEIKEAMKNESMD